MKKKSENGCKRMEIECVTCGGRGIIPTEESGKWLICPNCKGDGSKIVEMTPFTGRVLAEGVRTVSNDGHGQIISYEEFLSGDRPR